MATAQIPSSSLPIRRRTLLGALCAGAILQGCGGGGGGGSSLPVLQAAWSAPVSNYNAASVLGSEVREQGLTRIELFTQGGFQVTGSCAVSPNPWPSNFRDFDVGTVHQVWGWRSAVRKVSA